MHGISKVTALRLRISLEGIDPPIWRRVIFPKNATLHDLHRAIQVLFDWYDYHHSLDDDDRELVEWAGNDFDPEQFNVSQARHALILAAAWGCLDAH